MANSPFIYGPNGATSLVSGGVTLPGSTSGTIQIQPNASTTSYTVSMPAAQGGASTVLTNDGSGNLSWGSGSSSSATKSYELNNLGLATSVASNILTIALKQSDGATDPSTGSAAVSIGMRTSTATSGAYNVRSVTAALSMTVASGTTLNLQASVSQYLWVYAIDSDGAGTMKLGTSIILLDDGSLQSAVAESFTVTISDASPAVITANGHGLNNNDSVQFTTTGSLPTGLSTGTTYYVVSKATNTFEVAATAGGTAINTSSAGSGTHTAHINTVNGQMVSNAVYSSVAIRVIGRIAITETTPGTWASNATEIALKESVDFFAVGVIKAAYNISTGVSTTGSTPLNYNTVEVDSLGAVQTGVGIWKFVAPLAGFYSVSQGNYLGSGSFDIALYKNASALIHMSVSTSGASGQGTRGLQLVAGDYVDIRPSATVTPAQATISVAASNWISIVRQGN